MCAGFVVLLSIANAGLAGSIWQGLCSFQLPMGDRDDMAQPGRPRSPPPAPPQLSAFDDSGVGSIQCLFVGIVLVLLVVIGSLYKAIVLFRDAFSARASALHGSGADVEALPLGDSSLAYLPHVVVLTVVLCILYYCCSVLLAEDTLDFSGPSAFGCVWQPPLLHSPLTP